MASISPSQSATYAELQAERHRCEVAFVVRTCYPNPVKADSYFKGCEEHRPKAVVEQLRADTRVAWRIRQLADS